MGPFGVLVLENGNLEPGRRSVPSGVMCPVENPKAEAEGPTGAAWKGQGLATGAAAGDWRPAPKSTLLLALVPVPAMAEMKLKVKERRSMNELFLRRQMLILG